MAEPYKVDFQAMRANGGGFPPEAFHFVREGLAHTVKMVHGPDLEEREDEKRHVSGQQLCMGLKDHAIRQYGLLARAVLERWNIRATSDFGKIVFAMIEAGHMKKTDEDSLEDFYGVYDFDEAFATPTSVRH